MHAVLERPTTHHAGEQIERLIRASRASPGDVRLHLGIGTLLNEVGRHDHAVGACLVATALAPSSAAAQAELGRSLFLSGQSDAALEPCATAVTLAPNNVGSLVTLGAVLFTLGRFGPALDMAAEAVRLDPSHYQARANLALALEALGRLQEAEAQSRRALALSPDCPVARHNLAGLRLSGGLLDAESWALYDARLELTPQARRLGDIPRWRGEDVNGKTVLLHAEQGFGDVIQFSRYASMVRHRGARVVLAVSAPLLRLFGSLPGVDEVVEAGRLPAFDVFCPIASLPGVFGTTLDTVPPGRAYLAPPPDLLSRFAHDGQGGLQVGLVWAGNPGFVQDRTRSMRPEALASLACLPGVRFHSLQKGGNPPFPMQDRMEAVTDFADTAALIAGLDLVISVDTAVAHLAAAMGKPVWLLSRFMGCWRWLRDRVDSPWYPTVRIYRQATPGDWAELMGRVRTDLIGLVGR